MKTISRYIMTLALLITAATGAWADSGEIVVTVTAADLQADLSNPFTKDGVTIKCSDRMTGGLAFNELNEMSTTLGYFTKIEITNQFPEGISGINGVNGFSVNGTVATWTGKASSVGLGNYSVGPVVQFVFTIEPAGVDVTYNDAKTEASFQMPQYDVTATYTLKRDMTVDVTATIDDRIRIKKDGNDYQPVGADGNVDANAALPTVTDALDDANTSMTKETDYTLTLQKQGDTEDDWTDVTAYSVGNFRYKITGTGNYSGVIYTDPFELFEGYEVYVPAHEYVTYCSTEALTLEDENAALYTITAVSNSEATLSRALTVAPATTPLLVENNSDESRTILLIPTDEQADVVTPATEFKGVLTADEDLYKNDYFDYYAFNGLDFVRVVNTVTIPVGKCFIAIPTGNLSARSITIRRSATAIGATLVNSEEVNNEQWFDLNGRKVNKPTKKGIYIKNGQKVVIK